MQDLAPPRKKVLGAFSIALWMAGVSLACAQATPQGSRPNEINIGALFQSQNAEVEPSAKPPLLAKSATFAGENETPCRTDADCGYDPSSMVCGTDPRFNKQPPVIDQGVICYCEKTNNACSLLRVLPVPCEGDTSCAIVLEPRPHPIRATAEHPYQKPKTCTKPKPRTPSVTVHHATCERTNICTMLSRECAAL